MFNRSIMAAMMVFAGSSAFASVAPSETAVYSTKVSQLVQKELAAKKSTQTLVVLKAQADLSNAKLYSTRKARIGYVYATLVNHANKTQTNLITLLKSKKAKYRRFFISNAILVENATKPLVDEIAKMNEVSKILGNPKTNLTLPATFEKLDSATAIGDNLTAIGVDKVWATGNEGQNVVVAGQDTGYQWDHPALKNSYRGWNGTTASHDYNWHDSIHSQFNPKFDSVLGGKNKCGYELKAPCDDDQHGTHTMGTMVGSDGGQNQIGVAPKAKWIGCRNMDGGAGTPASYLECFQFFLAPTPVGGDAFTTGKPEMAPHVINNSWGCPSEEGCSGDEILPSLKAMKAAGIIVVASAGNDGPGCSTIKDPPAYHPAYVLSVGAMDHRTGNIAYFSSRGPSTFDGGVGPDVVAPGVSIRSSVPGSKYDQAMWSGTSMAGPHVVGQVALILSANPALIGKVDDVINLVRKSSQAVSTSESCGGLAGSAVPNNTYGYGRVRVFESVQAAKGMF
jgi:serine protease AprX